MNTDSHMLLLEIEAGIMRYYQALLANMGNEYFNIIQAVYIQLNRLLQL